MGDRSGKSDMDRLGFFQEMSYITIGDRYKSGQQNFINESAGKGRQMLPGGIKLPSALQAGYFTDKFGRVFEGEAYSDPVKLRRMRRLEESKRNLAKQFLPSNGEKLMCGLGNHYGTFSGPITSFSPLKKEGKSAKTLGKNVLTNPGKKGTGYGYIGVTLGKYPNNLSEPYDTAKERARKEVEQHKSSLKGGAFRLNMHPIQYFTVNPYHIDKEMLPPVRKAHTSAPSLEQKPFRPSHPGKRIGGAKMGTFDPYPSHSTDPYSGKWQFQHNVVNMTGKIFIPSQGPKSKITNSIINQNVLRSMNIQNFRSMTIA